MRKTLSKFVLVFLLFASVAAYVFLSEQQIEQPSYGAEQEIPVIQPDVKIVKQFMDGVRTVKVQLEQ